MTEEFKKEYVTKVDEIDDVRRKNHFQLYILFFLLTGYVEKDIFMMITIKACLVKITSTLHYKTNHQNNETKHTHPHVAAQLYKNKNTCPSSIA